MRWIQHSQGKVRRGDGEPPEGDLHFVDEKGSVALVGGKLYVDGRPARPGRHEVRLRDVVVPIDVDSKGRATRRLLERRAG